MPGAIIIGVGPGIGLSVARRFAREGLPVGVLARSGATVNSALAALADAGVEARGVTADAADEPALRAALDELVDHLGVPDVLVYNAANIQWDAIGELSAAEHLDAWAVNVVGAITAAAHLLPQMAEAGGGTYLITGGMPSPVQGVTSTVARPSRNTLCPAWLRPRSSACTSDEPLAPAHRPGEVLRRAGRGVFRSP